MPSEDLDIATSTPPADRVMGQGFTYACRIGFHAFERSREQTVVVDFEAELDWRGSSADDRALDVSFVDYASVNGAIDVLVGSRPWRLLEALCEDIATLICLRFPVQRVRVRVHKKPYDMPNADGVAVECVRCPADVVHRHLDDAGLPDRPEPA
jgi:dihydroneopterin aldolase